MTPHTGTAGLQSLLAKLVTNPSVATRLMSTRDPESIGVLLPHEDRRTLLQFFEEHGNAFQTSVLLLKKRRLDNILESLGIVSRLYSDYELSCLWDDYLTGLAFEAPSPKNPLLESIHFCQFLLGAMREGDHHRALVAYDSVRNEVAANGAADSRNFRREACNDVQEPSGDLVPLIHPCARAEMFDCNVSAMVKLLVTGQSRARVISAWSPTPERILFFKNWNKGGVGTLKVNDAVLDVMRQLDGEHTVAEIASLQKTQTGAPIVTNLLANLTKAGVVIFMRNKGAAR